MKQQHYITVRSLDDLDPLYHLNDDWHFRDFSYEIEEIEKGRDDEADWYTAYFYSAEKINKDQREIISQFPKLIDYAFNNHED
jgi:hypothetical protein